MKKTSRPRGTGWSATLALALACAACDQPIRYWVCDPPSATRLDALPTKLSETGLFVAPGDETLSPGVQAYNPRFALWSDGASKRRWIKLPAGTRIDSSDMDAWIFPEGTQLWKEFTRDGVRVETRLLQKVGPHDDDWVALAYLWSDDQRDAFAVPYGALDAHGTPHDVPAASECMACHGGTRSRVLGFSAIQLGGAAPEAGLDLRSLDRAGQLTQSPPDTQLALPGTPVEQAALGYMHANCSHCHNQDRPARDGARCFDPENALDFRLLTTALQDTASTSTYQTMGSVVTRGSPRKSMLFDLVSHRGFFAQMPPLATQRVDTDAVDTLRAWIEGL